MELKYSSLLWETRYHGLTKLNKAVKVAAWEWLVAHKEPCRFAERGVGLMSRVNQQQLKLYVETHFTIMYVLVDSSYVIYIVQLDL